MTKITADINKETLAFICSHIGVTIAFLAQRTGHTDERIQQLSLIHISEPTRPY